MQIIDYQYIFEEEILFKYHHSATQIGYCLIVWQEKNDLQAIHGLYCVGRQDRYYKTLRGLVRLCWEVFILRKLLESTIIRLKTLSAKNLGSKGFAIIIRAMLSYKMTVMLNRTKTKTSLGGMCWHKRCIFITGPPLRLYVYVRHKNIYLAKRSRIEELEHSTSKLLLTNTNGTYTISYKTVWELPRSRNFIWLSIYIYGYQCNAAWNIHKTQNVTRQTFLWHKTSQCIREFRKRESNRDQWGWCHDINDINATTATTGAMDDFANQPLANNSETIFN